MNNNKLFGAISLEENSNMASEPLEIGVVCAMEDVEHDVTIAAEQVNSGIAMVESAAEIAAALETNIAVEERVLAAGNVSAGAAAIANASLQANAVLLGMDPASVAISNESVDQSPETALKVSIESAKDTFKKIIDNIKAFFSKIWSKLKKLGAKIMLMVVDYEKKFKALDEKAGNLGSETKDGVKNTFTDSEGNKIVNKFYGLIALKGRLAAGDLSGYANRVKTGDAEVVSSIVTAISGNKVEAAMKAFGYDFSMKSYDGIPSYLTTDGSVLAISRRDGTTIKGMTFASEKVSLKTGDMTKITCTYLTGTAKNDVIAKNAKGLKLLSVADIKLVIAAGTTLADGVKDFAKNVDEVLSNVDKETKGLKIDAKGSDKDKEADEKKIESTYGTMMTSINTNALKFSSDSLLGYIGEMKNLMYLAYVSMSKYKAADAE